MGGGPPTGITIVKTHTHCLDFINKWLSHRNFYNLSKSFVVLQWVLK